MNDLDQVKTEEVSDAVMSVKPRGNIRIYACGGGGISLVGKTFSQFKPNEGQANLDIAYGDSSHSNVNTIPTIDKESFYHIVNPAKSGEFKTDGGGKDRAAMIPIVRLHLPKFLEVFPPSDELNIVVYSGGGATGSTLGPAVGNQLMIDGKTVIMIMVGSEDSETSARNTVNTWRTQVQMQSKSGKDWAMFYAHNNRFDTDGALLSNSQAAADDAVRKAIGMLTVLCSRRNEGLDSMDIHNSINLSVPLRIESGFSLLTVHTDNESINDYEEYCEAILSVYSKERQEIAKTPAYDGYGITPYNLVNGANGGVHFAFSRKAAYPIFEQIRSLAERLNNERTSTVGLVSMASQGIGKVKDVVDDDFIV